MKAPRKSGADDLKLIKGVGPKMEKLCNALGFWHFDQVAKWTPQEVSWVDENLEGFKGRVSRDNWVDQAKILASGAETEFSGVIWEASSIITRSKHSSLGRCCATAPGTIIQHGNRSVRDARARFRSFRGGVRLFLPNSC